NFYFRNRTGGTAHVPMSIKADKTFEKLRQYQYEPPRNTQLFKIAHLMGKSHRLQSLDRRLDATSTKQQLFQLSTQTRAMQPRSVRWAAGRGRSHSRMRRGISR